MTDFLMAFSGADLDHCDDERTPELIQKAMHETSARAILFHDYSPAAHADGRLMKVHPSELAGRPLFDPAIIFLGRENGTRRPWFTAQLQSPDNLAREDQFPDLRFSGPRMEPRDMALAGRARSLIHWHGTHGYCAQCGTKSSPVRGAASRICKTCEIEHYPRVNPVAIMLVEHTDPEGGDSILLGRQANWPEGSFSTLAGFVSPGEDIEECCIREVKEEVGLDVSGVRYLMSQTWPFPSQLMVGLSCTAVSREVTLDDKELEDAQWFTRAEVEAVFTKTGDSFVRPPRFTIAHQLIRHWLQTG